MYDTTRLATRVRPRRVKSGLGGHDDGASGVDDGVEDIDPVMKTGSTGMVITPDPQRFTDIFKNKADVSST